MTGMATNCVPASVRLPNKALEGYFGAPRPPKFALGNRRAKRRPTAFRSPLATFLIALSLIVQLFAAATPPAMAAPAFAGADDAAVAAELKALFGDAAQLCVQVNDDKVPARHAPSGHCCDQCPLCRFAAQAVAFVSPDLPVLPGQSIARRTRSARRPSGTYFLPIPPNQIRPGPLPSQSDGSPPRAPSGARSHSFKLENPLCQPLKSARPRAPLRAQPQPYGSRRPIRTPSAATASFPRRSPSTIPAFKTSSRCRPSVMFPSTPTAPTSGTRASAGRRRSPRASAW